ncbi:MAG: ABC transporter ATP-binding protein/permease [Chloroflexi bacterium]|nr:ABC transporter ATP-binding protein/permease [Chloroflexota bacterium]
MTGLGATLATIWRLAVPYFRSRDRWPGRILLLAIIGAELGLVFINVQVNQWNNRFYTGLQNRNWDVFWAELRFFCILAGAHIVLAVLQIYLNLWLEIRWRQFMTEGYLDRWLQGGTHYRMQLLGDAADNPDQRISEDIDQFISSTLSIGVGLLGAIVTLVSFVVILWRLSTSAPLPGLTIPGYLVWAALVYAVLGTLLTHLIGRPLIPLNFFQQRFEADFRFNLVRVRENSEQIALLAGAAAETDRLLDRFGQIVRNWIAIMNRRMQLTFFTAGYAQVSIVFPILVVAPAYFGGKMQLGGLIQTASAFGQVQGAFSFFINAYTQLAEYGAVINRLAGFEASMAAADAVAEAADAIHVEHAADGAVELSELTLRLPAGQPLLTAGDLTIKSGDSLMITGPTGAGKSTLFRAIAGVWPFGAGRVLVPAGSRVLVLPQRPYLPIGSLDAAVSYPAKPGVFERERVSEVLGAVGLPGLAEQLDVEAHWNRQLSLGEQQRLAIARAILHAPDFLFLDEATASLDEPSEAALQRLLRERLPNTALVSIGHRSTLRRFHRRHAALVPAGERFQVHEEIPA